MKQKFNNRQFIFDIYNSGKTMQAIMAAIGISHATMMRLRRGEEIPTRTTIAKIARYFHRSPARYFKKEK